MKCDIGDLCVILPGALPENVGAFVTVEGPAFLLTDKGFVWRVSSPRPLLTLSGSYRTEGTIEDCFLQPIRPKPQEKTNSTAAPNNKEVSPA